MARTAVRLQRPEVSWSTIRRQGSTGLVFAHQDMKMHVTHRRAMHAGPPHQVPAVIACTNVSSRSGRDRAGQRRQMLVAGIGWRQQQDHQIHRTIVDRRKVDRLGQAARTTQRAASARRAAHAEARNPCPVRWNPDSHGPATHQRSRADPATAPIARPPRQLLQKLCLVGDAQPDNDIVRPDKLADRHQSGALSR